MTVKLKITQTLATRLDAFNLTGQMDHPLHPVAMIGVRV